MQKAVFLDRDGIINEETGDYVFKIKDFHIVDGIIDILKKMKATGYLLIVITNQAGIAKGRYVKEDMDKCHDHFQEQSGGLISKFYYAPGHPDYSESLSRKPDSLLFEKAMAKFNIDPTKSWMVGDKERDIVPAKKWGIKTIRLLPEAGRTSADYSIKAISETTSIIL